MRSQEVPHSTWLRNLPVVDSLNLLSKGDSGIHLEHHLNDTVQSYSIVGGGSQHANVKTIIVAGGKVFLVYRDNVFRTAFKVGLVDGKSTDAPTGLFTTYTKAVEAVLDQVSQQQDT